MDLFLVNFRFLKFALCVCVSVLKEFSKVSAFNFTLFNKYLLSHHVKGNDCKLYANGVFLVLGLPL